MLLITQVLERDNQIIVQLFSFGKNEQPQWHSPERQDC